jgi:hypothetical protein
VSDSTSCSTDGTTEVLCNVITACKWDDDDAKCEGDEVSAILLVNNKCQGSFSDTLLEYYNAAASTSLTTIAEIHPMFSCICFFAYHTLYVSTPLTARTLYVV